MKAVLTEEKWAGSKDSKKVGWMEAHWADLMAVM
jgi:uncharacterized protein with PIN domain